MKITRTGKLRDRRALIVDSKVKYLKRRMVRNEVLIDLYLGGLSHDWIVTLDSDDIERIAEMAKQ